MTTADNWHASLADNYLLIYSYLFILLYYIVVHAITLCQLGLQRTVDNVIISSADVLKQFRWVYNIIFYDYYVYTLCYFIHDPDVVVVVISYNVCW